MKKKLFKRLAVVCSALCLGLSVMVAPAATMPVEAAKAPTASVQKEVIGWIFAECGDSLYKRLFNHSTGQWLGDWIYVRDL